MLLLFISFENIRVTKLECQLPKLVTAPTYFGKLPTKVIQKKAEQFLAITSINSNLNNSKSLVTFSLDGITK